MREKLLITGASGFVGFHLIQKALAQNYEVFAAVRGSSNINHLKEMNVQIVNFNYADKSNIRDNFKRDNYDYIIHAAGQTRARNIQEYNLANAEFALNLAEVALEFPIKKFVFLSSLAALGPLAYDDINLIDENTVPNPITNYGKSKLYAEQLLNSLEGLPLITFRPTAVYGERERDLLIMFKTINKGLEPYIGKIKQWFSFIYVGDLANVIFNGLKSDKINATYNISDGNAYDRFALSNSVKKALHKKTIKLFIQLPIVKLIAQILEKTSKKKTPVLNKEKLNELTARNWKCSIEKAITELDFQPKYNLETGIEQTINWYKKNNWL